MQRFLTLKNSLQYPLTWQLLNEEQMVIATFRGSKFTAYELANIWISSFVNINITITIDEAKND